MPTNAGARVHDKIMLRCLTEHWNAHVAYWSYRPGPTRLDAAASLHVVPFNGHFRFERPAAALGLLVAKRPIPIRQFLTRPAVRKLRTLLSELNPDVIVLSCVELGVTLPLLRKHSHAKLVVDVHDVQTTRCKMIYDSIPRSDLKQRTLYYLLHKSFDIIEHQYYRYADVAWVLKEEDAAVLASFNSVPAIDVVPNVIDPESLPSAPNFDSVDATPVQVVYVGNYAGAANEQCALRLLDGELLRNLGSLEVCVSLVGVNPTPAMYAAATHTDTVTITGAVDDLGDYLKPVDSIFAAPLLAGGGVKRKVIEAMMHGCPVVTTEVGAEGLSLRHGETAIVVAPDEIPEQLMRLARNRAERLRIARNGYLHVTNHFGYERLVGAVSGSLSALARH